MAGDPHHSARVELPPRLAMLVGLDASDPANWPDVVRRLLDDLHRPAWAAPVPPPCPYPGMTPFRESDSGHFYGRETEVAEMVERLRLTRSWRHRTIGERQVIAGLCWFDPDAARQSTFWAG